MKKNVGGRPTVMGEATLEKLRQAFSNSFTDIEACLYADINPQTLYNYCKEHPEYLEYKENLKKSPNMKAKLNWIGKIKDGEYQASKERLERKSRNEFSLKSELELSGGMDVNMSVDLSNKNVKELEELRNKLLK